MYIIFKYVVNFNLMKAQGEHITLCRTPLLRVFSSKYAAIGFENMRHFVLVPSPAHENDFFLRTFILNCFKISNLRFDVPYSFNIIKLNAAIRLE